MSKLHFRQPLFTYSACEPFTNYPERFQKFRETGNLKHNCKNELDKACFGNDATCHDSKDLAKMTISDKNFQKESYLIAVNPTCYRNKL